MSVETTVDRSELRELVADTLDVEPSALTDEALFIEEMQVDSVLALELAVTLEQRYRIKIAESEIITIRRFPDVCDLLARKLSA
ncbi:acyl carrier protein [Amycolatopsis sp. H20-H5]|uniref:acyl carrier protein n=1 Tax=Amycolatopsis sp. H20-H5 TaxID=3046309 RepID=UPI002DBFBEF4|nr:acyl carrier protein [Amycolatopsis sp. H20-H5]MEC3976383.1 acyl carrier protein [Amycolatopsis sp. H20-H5]